MKAKASDWYRNGWTLDIKTQSWVENTSAEVDFAVRTLGLTPGERVLDLACGFGRHSLELARRGFRVVGLDITPEYVEDARRCAEAESLDAEFVCADIREARYSEEFDAVLNLADGAIGYLESDEENLKIFDVVSRALRGGGGHLMDVCNAEHAELYFPRTNWEAGESAIALAEFDWDPATRRMLYGGADIPYGVPARKPEIPAGDPTRLYTIAELRGIFAARGMTVAGAFSDYDGSPLTPKKLQMIVYSVKR